MGGRACRRAGTGALRLPGFERGILQIEAVLTGVPALASSWLTLQSPAIPLRRKAYSLLNYPGEISGSSLES